MRMASSSIVWPFAQPSSVNFVYISAEASVDPEGNWYVAEAAHGPVQKFRQRPGANPQFLVGKPVYSAWK
jgi:hypothetical protein